MHAFGCWPCPSPWEDPELERLRRLKQQREVEEEKARLREWLHRHGMPQPSIPPCPLLPCWPPSPRPAKPYSPSVEDVLRRIG